MFALAVLSGSAVTALSAHDTRFPIRCAGIVALAVFIGVTMLGTVPINKAVLNWAGASPPEDWRDTIARWERVDTVRTWAAGLAFSLFVFAALD